MGEKQHIAGKCLEKHWIENDSKLSHGYGIRHVQMACMCVCVTALMMARSSMAVAVLAMTDAARRNDSGVTIYEWDKQTQGVILSSFFWGYVVMQIPAGLLAKKFGGKLILLVALLANGVLCFLLPTLGHLGGWRAVCGARVAMGLTQACLYPASHTLLGRWLPPRERTLLSGIVYGGTQLGTILGMPLSGLLAETALGWKLIFYVMGVLMLATAALWAALAASSPAEHRLISPEEKDYIQIGLGLGTGEQQAARGTPWRHFFRSVPLYAVMVTHVGCAIGFTLFFVDMPTYLEKGLGISLKNSASLAALPYIGMWFGGILSTLLCEKIYNSGLLTLGACRKLFNSIGLFGVAAGLVGLSLLGPEHSTLAVIMLVAILSAKGFTMAGFMVNHLDLSPQYGGVLLSMTNLLAASGAVVTPLLTGLVLRNDPTDVSRWHVLFLIIAGISALGNCAFLVWGSADRQPWDDPDFEIKKTAIPEELKLVMNTNKGGKEHNLDGSGRADTVEEKNQLIKIK